MKRIGLLLGVVAMVILIACNGGKDKMSEEAKKAINAAKARVELVKGELAEAEAKLAEVKNATYDSEELKKQAVLKAEKLVKTVQNKLEVAEEALNQKVSEVKGGVSGKFDAVKKAGEKAN